MKPSGGGLKHYLEHTQVGFDLEPSDIGTQVHFYDRGWPEANEHDRISCHCWAMYLGSCAGISKTASRCHTTSGLPCRRRRSGR